MKLHIITVGKPKLHYAQDGWQEYLKRLEHYHTVRVTHLADKWAYDSQIILKTAAKTHIVTLAIDGIQLSSEGLADFLKKQALESREVSFIIGGPKGLPQEVIDTADFRWSLSKLTFPHDLAMVVLLETLYRSSTIVEGHPYHKA